MPDQESRLWTKGFILLTLSSLLLSLSFYLLLPTLPVYLVEELQASSGKVGWIVGVYTFAAVLIRPFTGWAIDLFGRRMILIIAMAFFALFIGLYAVSVTLLQFLILRFFHGISWGITTTTNSTVVVDIIPAKRKGEGIGFFGLAMPLAMAIGPLLGLVIIENLDWNMLFLTGTLIASLSFILLLFIRFPHFKRPSSLKLTPSSLISKRSLPISLVMLITMISYGGIISFITLYAEHNKIGKTGIFFTVYAIMLAITRVVSGKVFDKHGPSMLVIIGLAAVASGTAILGGFPYFSGLVASGAMFGIGFGIIFPTFQAMVNNLEPASRRGAANSTLFTALDTGIGLGAIFTGYLMEGIGFNQSYLLLSVVTISALAFFILMALPHYQKMKNKIFSF